MGKNKKKLYFYLAIIIIIFIVPFSFDVKANQNQQSSISIFINSYPYKADIYLNKKYVGQSPIIVRDIVSSKIEVKIIKKDYFPFSTDLKVEKDEKYKSLYIVLSNKKISLSSLDSKVNIKSKTYDSPVSIENMPSGFYRIYKKNDTIYIVPDNFKFFISLLSYFLTGFSTYLTISNPSNVNLIVMTVASAVLSIYFLFTTAFPKKVDLTVNTNPQNKPDETLFLKGQSLINQGEYDLAIDQFLAIIDNFPESYYIPHAIYYIAFCYDATSQY
ncbi:MAG TPA: PEGA domain-containing protein, partial [Exilispira sp.]|nr:PEGA domain-containing protein [Exilispira sp.]